MNQENNWQVEYRDTQVEYRDITETVTGLWVIYNVERLS